MKNNLTLIEKLKEIDKKSIDDGTHFYDLTTLFESVKPKLTPKEASDLKRVIDTRNPEMIDASIKAALEEGIDDWNDENDPYYYDDEDIWELLDRKSVQDYDGFWTDYTLWHNNATDNYVCIFGDRELYTPQNSDFDAEFETEEEALEWFEDYNGYEDDLEEDINRYSDVVPKEDRKYWYFTTHGVQPGSIPKDLNVLEIKDTPSGTFVALDGILNTSELKEYDMKEKVPFDNIDESLYEANYGGAYDIEDDMFFTRDDINEFAEDVVDEFSNSIGKKCSLQDVYMATPTRIVLEVECDGEFYNVDTQFDMRKIRRPKDIYKYKNTLIDLLKDSYDFDEYYELSLDDYYESLNETILSPGDEYDYFEVRDEYGSIGEYPTYEDAKNACKDDTCHIYGMTQYGGAEYEDTLLEDVNYDSFITKEEGLLIVPFNYYIYYDGNMDEIIDYREEELIDASNRDLFNYLNSDSVRNEIREKLQLEINSIEYTDSDISLHYDELRGKLDVVIEETDNLQVDSLFSALNKLVHKWKFSIDLQIDGPKRDVDDWDSWDDTVYAEADLDYYEN